METHRPQLSTLSALALCLSLGACINHPTIYAWGEYDDTVRELTTNPDAVDVPREIARMTEIVRASSEAGKSVPPGVHAQLGYLYAMQGDIDTATAAFLSEKELYPESAVFVDGVLARMAARPNQEGATP